MNELVLPSGAVIPQPKRLIDAFFSEEWAYYDGIDDLTPNQIQPVDVVATLSVNSFLNSATRIRSVHRGLATACERHLADIPVEADLRAFPLDQLVDLLHAACQVPYVLIPVATKVLHRKRRSLIPMLDTVVSNYYLDCLGRGDLRASTQDKKRAATAARVPLEGFKLDLDAAWEQLTDLRAHLDSAGFPVTELRILEVLVWIWADPQRQYLKLHDTLDRDQSVGGSDATTSGADTGISSFDIADLRSRGFEGFIRVHDFTPDPQQVPTSPGVYAVVRPSADPPKFLDASPASWFKREDPTVALERLQAEFVPGVQTLYIGSAANLRERIGLLVEFSRAGPEKSVFHRGGRLLWQIEDAQDLLVAWRVEPEGIGTVERDLVDEFEDIYGRYPFGNLKRPPIRE